jgi:hypothetical protein
MSSTTPRSWTVADQIDAKLIDGHARTVREMFTSRKYGLDFYQREYTWTETNVSELIDDLANSFLEDYDPGDARTRVASYRPYFLGPVVISRVESTRYLVDGQQRLTTLTLLLIHLDNLSRERPGAEPLSTLVYSQLYGQTAFNIDVDDREEVMQAVLHGTPFDPTAAPESARNIWDRYNDIVTHFPDELSNAALLHFIDWLLERVVLVEIGTTDQDMALEIFETMNDRGMRLSNTDMLKSFLIARMEEPTDITPANELWRNRVEELIATDRNADGEFLKSWLRGKFADTIRDRKKDAVAKDFDLIGTAFHKWARDNKEHLGLHKPGDYVTFVNRDFERMSRRYLQVQVACSTFSPGMEAVFYNARNGVTLQHLLIMAAVNPTDDDETFKAKAQLVASYLDLMVARRMVNYRNFGYSTLSYTMFNLAKDIRDLEVEDIRAVLADRVAGLEESFGGMHSFGLTQRNRSHIAYLLARMTDWVEESHGVGFPRYVTRDTKTPFEVEHIWANHFDRHTDEFANAYDFANARNRFGDLLLLPKDFNASYGDKTYLEKLPHYFGQNLLAQSLHPYAYQHNPSFLGLIQRTGLPFKAYPDGFTLADVEERHELYRQICEHVWDPEALGLGGGTPVSQSRDFYIAFGLDGCRDWDDARTYGFISAGGARRYSQPLHVLKPGDRVFVCVPGKGYVGVGVVVETARPLATLEVSVNGGLAPLRHQSVAAPNIWHDSGDGDKEEHGVKVDWIHTKDLVDAVWQTGMFANQNIACRLHDPLTRDVLAVQFDVEMQ